jgi:very-short-patch-repair endonuclease
MGAQNGQSLWKLAREQHGVLSRRQLLDAGLSAKAVRHRVSVGRIRPVHRGVYAVGQLKLTRQGRWMAAVLACGAGAALSHGSAGTLLRLGEFERQKSVCVPPGNRHRRPGIRIHRAHLPISDVTTRHRIPVTSPTRTLLDLATELTPRRLEAAVNAADWLDLIDPERLRSEVAARPGARGAPALRAVLDAPTFAFTDSELERRFLRLVRDAGLPAPETQVPLHGFRVDFLWREANLVVETDGLRYHRTAAQQTADRRRDQALAASGLTVLRFTHAQISHEGDWVAETLRSLLARTGVAAGAA